MPMQEHYQEEMLLIADLFILRLQNQLGAEDRQLLETWLERQEPDHRAYLEGMTDMEQIKDALRYLYRIDTEKALADTQKKILAEDTRTTPAWPVKFLSHVRLIRYVAAAVTILLVGGAAVFIFRRSSVPHEQPVAQRFHNDVAPGGNKAILQLADGSHIVLDSAANGEVTSQGSARIIKLADGQLTYALEKDHASAGNHASAAVEYNVISTPRGGQYTVTLPDGSKVWLNAASSLRFPTSFTGAQRLVELQGEAYFEVTRQPAMPFRVRVLSQGSPAAQPLLVDVLGTAFDVESYSEEHEQKTTLIQGSVKVSASSSSSILLPGQQALLSEGSDAIQKTAAVKTEDVIAWKNGLFLFREASIQTVLRQIARWYDIDIVYKGKIDQEFFGKIPRSVPLSTLLKILESTGSVHFSIEGKTITATP